MNTTRDKILQRISQTLDKTSTVSQRQQQLTERLSQRPRGPVRQLPDDLKKWFIDKVHAVSATLVEVAERGDIPDAVLDYINQQQLAKKLVCAPVDSLQLEWGNVLEVRFGKAEDTDKLAVTEAWCAIAETGTLVLPSSPDRPTTLNFLPDYFICVLEEKNILPDMEATWAKYREQHSDMPRVINLVTGPSRTADVEQTIQLGAHGPRQLHVILVKGRETSDAEKQNK